MKLTFLGAAHEVTGSCTLLSACGKNILVDRGMEQGENVYESAELPLAPGAVDAVLLTHAHIDHSGLLPLLCKNGYTGPIYATGTTAQLCDIMLRDSAHIQEFEAEWRNRKNKRAGAEPYVPLYTMEDAMAAIQLFKPCAYGPKTEIVPGVEARFVDAGHLLGSASIEVWVTENGKTEKILFSGDIGNLEQPIIKDPTYLDTADYVVMESTYGDREHGPRPDYLGELSAILQETFDKGGNVVIPSFAVGRAQEMLYFLRQIKAEGRIKGHDNFPVYIDSPLANEATNIFHENVYECFDEQAMELINQGINPIQFPGLITSASSDDSIAINTMPGSKVIISASGMCEAGRIRHHLKHNLWRPDCTILFVGYQASGTLGRALVEGAPRVKLFGETIQVKARIAQLTGLSGHADCNGLRTWLKHLSPAPRMVFVNHGDDGVCDGFARAIQEEFGIEAVAPYPGAEYDTAEQRWISEGNKTRKQPKVAVGGQYPPSEAYRGLLDMSKKLQEVVAHNAGGSNKDLKKFAAQLEELCQKWDR